MKTHSVKQPIRDVVSRGSLLYVLAFWAACVVLLESQSCAQAPNTCFTCIKCQNVEHIFNSKTDADLWKRNGTKPGLLECPLTNYPVAGQCVPCSRDLLVYIVCASPELRLDMEDRKGNSFSPTNATCPTLEIVGDRSSQSFSHAGHVEPSFLSVLIASFIILPTTLITGLSLSSYKM